MPLDTSTLSHLKTLHTQADKDYDTPLYVQRYMAISPEQGQWLYELVVGRNSKNVIEFGASFGVSTIYLAAAAKQTKGHVITTEIESTKIPSLRQNLQQVNLSDTVEIRIGDALQTLSQDVPPIDVLFMDGYKTMYEDLFVLLEPYFKPSTIIIADNTDMKHASVFKESINSNPRYSLKLKQFKRSEVSIVSLA